MASITQKVKFEFDWSIDSDLNEETEQQILNDETNQKILMNDALKRAYDMSEEGYIEGELCSYLNFEEKEEIEIRGWWKANFNPAVENIEEENNSPTM